MPEGESVDRGWRVLEVVGPLDFSLTGVIASLVTPLAEAGVPIFVISTFESDYVLVRERDLGGGRRARGRRPRLRGLTRRARVAYPVAMTSVSRSWWAWRTERGGSLRGR